MTSSSFTTILIPVDFSINTEIAVKKALALIDSSQCEIYLLHVVPSAFFSFLKGRLFKNIDRAARADINIARRKLEEWKDAIAETAPGVRVHTHISKAKPVQHEICKYAADLHPDIIIIGKHNYHNWFGFLNTVTPAILARATACSVLTVKLGSLHNKIKSIVFPVQSGGGDKRLDALIILARKFRARIYLVMLEQSTQHKALSGHDAFIETYRTIKGALNTPINHVVLTGGNLARASVQFAESVNADLVLIDPSNGRSPALLYHKNINDIIKGNSKLEILSIES